MENPTPSLSMRPFHKSCLFRLSSAQLLEPSPAQAMNACVQHCSQTWLRYICSCPGPCGNAGLELSVDRQTPLSSATSSNIVLAHKMVSELASSVPPFPTECLQTAHTTQVLSESVV